ncbi:MAG TPA: DoxX family protein [Bacteroidia bacterium]|nr:DoxX family protein [Bacteroidia bacterium]
MNTLTRLLHWGDTHHPAWLDFVRIALGSFLFYKGIEFARDGQDLKRMMGENDMRLWSMFLTNYIPLVHFAGGLLIALGLITRWAVLFNLPILVGAVILTGQGTGAFELYEFTTSLIVMILLVVFFVEGSGPLSADHFIYKYDNGKPRNN